MSVSALVLAAAVTAAQPINAPDWVTPQDYPAVSATGRQGGSVVFRVVVSKDGRPQRCDVVESSGYEALDRQSCALVMLRSRFEPALDSSGSAVIAVYKNTVRWWLPNDGVPQPKPRAADIDLTVAKLPDGIEDPVKVEVGFMVDADGKMSDCSVVMPAQLKGRARKLQQAANDRLGRLACDRAMAMHRPSPALDEKDKALPSVQTAKISFATEAGARKRP